MIALWSSQCERVLTHNTSRFQVKNSECHTLRECHGGYNWPTPTKEDEWKTIRVSEHIFAILYIYIYIYIVVPAMSGHPKITASVPTLQVSRYWRNTQSAMNSLFLF